MTSWRNWVAGFLYPPQNDQDIWWLESLVPWRAVQECAQLTSETVSACMATLSALSIRNISFIYWAVGITATLGALYILQRSVRRYQRRKQYTRHTDGQKTKYSSLRDNMKSSTKYEPFQKTNSPRRGCMKQTKTAKVLPYNSDPRDCRPVPDGDTVHAELVSRHSANTNGHRWDARRVLLICGISAFLVSIPWEFVRLYQQEVAKKAARAINAIPPECVPDQMPVWRWALHLILSPFTWENPECETYHIDMLTDPLWEVTPAVVFCSLLSRCILTPMDALCRGAGEGTRLLLHKVPWQWQPFVMILAAVLVVVIIAMVLGYRIVLPMLLRLEPGRRTPVVVRVRPMRYQDASENAALDDSDSSLSICQ